MNDKIDMKSQRVKGYFLEAAKQIILTEGVENVTARKVADIAGYSYATIYNYFKDIDELLGKTKELMVMDVMKYMENTTDSSPGNMEDFIRLFVSYVQYYLDNPHIFRFFYFYRLSDDEAGKEQYDFSAPWESALRFLVEDGSIKTEEAEDCAKTLIYAVHGLLTLFFSGNGLTEEILFKDVGKIINFTLRR